jgi:hypothetical protein
MATESEIHALHRYFVTADRMRVHFYDFVSTHPGTKVESRDWTELFLYMSLWYGCLFVVVEGWGRLRLTNTAVDRLRSDPKTGMLKKFRHAVFHYEPEYWTENLQTLLREGDTSAKWVAGLHEAIGQYFLDWFAQLPPE